ncbi:MAG: exo-alpha-sialidase [Faecousia sp.]
MKKCKRFLALLLVLCMMLSVVPFSAFAAEGSDETTDGGSQNATVETVAEETTAEETTGETTVEETTEETTVEETTEAITEAPVAEEEDETLEGGIASFALTREAAGYALTMGTKPADGTTTGNPFVQGTGGSNSFRIPAMVTLSDGTIVAAADARWNTTYDGGGLDTIVSYSTDNGANWNYTFANYLGDNGNTYNGSGSTAFIDPALATDGSTVYMLCDLYPYGVALNGSGNTAPSTAVGFNSDGTLKLAKNDSSSYDYYLKDGQIYDSSDNVVSGYTVDAYFNITGTDGTSSNLFFSDSPYQVVRTGYLYLTKSTDGGKNWSAPTLIPNVKTSSEQVCLVGPGRGLVTDGKIIFPVYSYNSGNQQMGFIYSTDGKTWTRSANFTGASWSSEAAVVALSDGTLRFFYRNGTSALCYVDYSWTTNSWGSAVNTGIATNSNTQISAISYSKTVDGKQVILVSCPTGSNSNGSADSSASARLNGKIFVGYVNSDKTMSWQSDKAISVTSNNSQFMYSCLTELSNGKVAILYENKESAWGTGDNCYYTMDFQTYDLGLTDPVTVTDANSSVFATAKGLTSVSAQKQDNAAPYAGYSAAVTYSITLNGGNYTGSAEIKIPYDSTFDGCTDFIGNVANDDNTVDTFPVKLVDGYFVGTVPHFSDVTISGRALTGKDVTLEIGGTETITDNTGNYSGNYTGPDTSIAKIEVTGTDEQEGGVKYTQASVTCNTLISSNSNNWTAVSGYYYTPDGTNYYPLYAKRSRSYVMGTGWTYTYTWGYSTTSSTSNVTQIGTQSTTSTSTTPNITVYTQSAADPVAASTTITFTGVSAGTTTAVVGSTQYNITVNRKTESVNLVVGGTKTFDDASTGTPVVGNSTVASATLSGDQLTITGLKDGTTTVTTDTTVYTVTVSDGTPISIKENTTETISVTLEDGQTVEWSSADSNYVGVAGKYDTTAGAYTNAAILAGQNVTSSPVTVTATIKDADGNVVGTQKWLVTVTAGDADTNTSSKGIYFNISTIENCTVYYSINGGELIPINGTGVSTGEWTGNGTYTGRFNIMFFAAPDDGYALTYMYIEGTDGQYYTLANGSNPDGTDSDAWPFIDPARDTIPTSNSDATIWKTVNGSLHGFRWALLEGNMTIERMKVLFSNAIALGCDGVTTQTKNSTDGIGSASDPMEVKFVAQKLPTVEKTITSITRGSETIPYTEGMKVKIGDTINYSVVVTRYATNATYGTITYDNEKLTDELTNDAGISNPDMGTSTTSDKAYTYTTSLTLTNENFGTVVKRGAITNEVKFSYTYSSQYSAGSMNAKASAVAEVTVDIPSYVVDFGLPVEIDLLENGNNDGKIISCSNGLYGSAKVNDAGTGFTYTLDQVMQDVDYIEFTYILNNAPDYEYTYTVAIYPATTVYYEEGFAAYTGTWTGNASKGSGTQATRIAGSNEDEYGYDQKYAHENAGPSNGTQATSSAKGDKAEFAFTGTGVDIYANCTPQTGWLMIHVKNGDGNTVKVVTVKLLQVNTALQNGGSSATTGQAVSGYNVPVASITGLSHGNYTVTITNISTEEGKTTVNLDGFRIYGTLATEPDFYQTDEEDKPTFIELRDQVLAGLSVTYTGSDQVYAGGEIPDGAQVAVVASSAKYTQANVDDLLKNGPKNEIYLQPGQALVLKITTAREVQIGLKALNAATTYTITGKTGDQSISTSTDMFYTVLNKNTSVQQTITITNNGEGILSVTKLKVCDDPNAALAPLTWEDLATALSNLGIGGDTNGSEITNPVEPTEPEQPEVVYADATLSVSLVDYAGKRIASVNLTDNGVAGETKAFTAEEVLAAAKANVPKGYVLVDESKVTGAEVAYGESGKVTVRIDKMATLNVIYVNLRGKNVGTATITKVQTSGGSYQFSASEIRANAPAGYRAVWLTGVKVPYGSDRTIIVPVL